MPHISLAAETLWHVGPLPITNSMLATWTVMGILLLFSYFSTKNLSLVPSYIQSIAEVVIDSLYAFFGSVVGHQVRRIFPLVATFFLFIVIANWEGLLPGFGTIGYFHKTIETSVPAKPVPEAEGILLEETGEAVAHTESVPEDTAEKVEKVKFTPLLRGATADLNMTIALAIIAFFAIQYFGFSTLGGKYSRRFINFANPILFFVGILEIVSDISKIISFAFRLFGNIFAGEVLLTVMAFLMPLVAPIPFLVLELFVGFIQAIVFSTLTAVFVNVAVAHEE